MLAKPWPVLLVTILILSGCVSPPPPEQAAPASTACQNPVYLELSTQHPDSLSTRGWERLQQLSAECRAETDGKASAMGPSRDHRYGAWLLMPAMMLLGGMMWLMGGF